MSRIVLLLQVKCWQIRRQTKAPQAAGTIHTDFERGFICDEVMKFDDLKELGSIVQVQRVRGWQEGRIITALSNGVCISTLESEIVNSVIS
ncbi:hypothetical protein D5086_003915 [Populus alba]|uniref:Uncharacterized protein n=1 Tax=Populus alba TaxID=43335 RepID=A0ACC4D6Z5_POPAL